ncbi:MAG TPA: transporter substrate-binding domain-containing protein, partial [Desulfurivibrionaceae bacterium]|nr:transporter substrate-binding domain-containing protein [Desulfurivibrionaceae bacterium]
MKRWLRRRLVPLMLMLFALAPALVVAQTNDEPLRVGITEVPPFVMQSDSGEWEGISIDLWRRVAENLGQDYQWVPLPFSD